MVEKVLSNEKAETSLRWYEPRSGSTGKFSAISKTKLQMTPRVKSMNDYYACNLHNKQIDHKITYNLYLQSFFINKIK